MEKAVLRVDGMSCDHCVKTITKAVGELPSVKNVAIDIKGGTVSFMFDPAKSPLENVEAVITDAGYDVKRLLKNYNRN
ncbi:MAG: copper ion binding protein [Treponema sp.]|jgi:copper chaperone|nr:copper ion binding protein [Treponema sp.]